MVEREVGLREKDRESAPGRDRRGHRLDRGGVRLRAAPVNDPSRTLAWRMRRRAGSLTLDHPG